MRRNWFARGIAIVVLAFAAIVLFGYVTMHLWNWLMPAVFGLHTITFWQAIGLMLLGKILFGGGFRGRPGGRSRWKNRMQERWGQMSPEERERMRAGMRGRWGCGFGHDREPATEQKPAV